MLLMALELTPAYPPVALKGSSLKRPLVFEFSIEDSNILEGCVRVIMIGLRSRMGSQVLVLHYHRMVPPG